MTGFTAFVRKEFEEIRKTSRMWVLPGIMLFFGLTNPILAKLTPLLLKSTAGTQSGLVIQMPDPPTSIRTAVSHRTSPSS